MRRIFISGPMSDLPDMNYPAFHRLAAALRAQGHHVENPAENPAQPDWPSYMALSLAQMLTCQEVVLLPGWEQSSGAVWEASVAHGLGKPVGELIGGCTRWSTDIRLRLIPLPAPGALRKEVAA